jgi:tetratricopeptide (TPR) repeat protein
MTLTIPLPTCPIGTFRLPFGSSKSLFVQPPLRVWRGWIPAWIGLGLCLWLAVPALAAMGDPDPGEPAWLTEVRKELKAQRFDQAASALKTANAVESAEWHNLLGYALRKKSPPDLVAAETHYKRALELDPKHRHAMEYYGELFLMKGDLAGAEAMLKRLDRACFFGCEELRDLKKAIERFKAARK